MDYVLGIDQSFAKTGVVILSTKGLEEAFILPRVEANSRQEEAVLLARSINNILDDWRFDLIVMEGIPFMSRSNITRDLAGLQYTIYSEYYCSGYGDSDILIVPPTQLKKFATGSGTAGKGDMIEAVTDKKMQEILMETKKTKGRDDLADAWHLARFGLQHLEGLEQ